MCHCCFSDPFHLLSCTVFRPQAIALCIWDACWAGPGATYQMGRKPMSCLQISVRLFKVKKTTFCFTRWKILQYHLYSIVMAKSLPFWKRATGSCQCHCSSRTPVTSATPEMIISHPSNHLLYQIVTFCCSFKLHHVRWRV